MCLHKTENDGGLRALLETADRVSRDLTRAVAVAAGEDGGDGVGGGPCGDGGHASISNNRPSRAAPSKRRDGGSTNTDPARIRSSAALGRVLAPLVRDLGALDASALLAPNPRRRSRTDEIDEDEDTDDGMDDGGGRGRAASIETVRPIHGAVLPPCHNYSHSRNGGRRDRTVRYLHVKECPGKYSCGIFVFPPFAEIPLHDHPGMAVLSRVLYGELCVRSYDVLIPIEKGSDDGKKMKETTPPSPLRSPFQFIRDFMGRFSGADANRSDNGNGDGDVNELPAGVLRAQETAPNVLPAPCVTGLYPREQNFHSFRAGPSGAAVLDVLMPPYDPDSGRDCTFYRADAASRGDVGDGNDRDGGCDDSGWNGYSDEVGDDGGKYHGNGEGGAADEDIAAKADEGRAGPGSHSGCHPRRRPRWKRPCLLVPVDQPDDFRCVSGTYGRFGACVANEESDSGGCGSDDELGGH